MGGARPPIHYARGVRGAARGKGCPPAAMPALTATTPRTIGLDRIDGRLWPDALRDPGRPIDGKTVRIIPASSRRFQLQQNGNSRLPGIAQPAESWLAPHQSRQEEEKPASFLLHKKLGLRLKNSLSREGIGPLLRLIERKSVCCTPDGFGLGGSETRRRRQHGESRPPSKG